MKEKKAVIGKVLLAIGVLAAIAFAAYRIYRYFSPDYLDDFEDDFEDDFDEDPDEEEKADAEEADTSGNIAESADESIFAE